MICVTYTYLPFLMTDKNLTVLISCLELNFYNLICHQYCSNIRQSCYVINCLFITKYFLINVPYCVLIIQLFTNTAKSFYFNNYVHFVKTPRHLIYFLYLIPLRKVDSFTVKGKQHPVQRIYKLLKYFVIKFEFYLRCKIVNIHCPGPFFFSVNFCEHLLYFHFNVEVFRHLLEKFFIVKDGVFTLLNTVIRGVKLDKNRTPTSKLLLDPNFFLKKSLGISYKQCQEKMPEIVRFFINGKKELMKNCKK